uniref:Uncharacterized protein n=1 Tax=Oryza glumipatula TaxID=40148 RepID=A0A0D9Z9E3_9ORYZ
MIWIRRAVQSKTRGTLPGGGALPSADRPLRWPPSHRLHVHQLELEKTNLLLGTLYPWPEMGTLELGD